MQNRWNVSEGGRPGWSSAPRKRSGTAAAAEALPDTLTDADRENRPLPISEEAPLTLRLEQDAAYMDRCVGAGTRQAMDNCLRQLQRQGRLTEAEPGCGGACLVMAQAMVMTRDPGVRLMDLLNPDGEMMREGAPCQQKLKAAVEELTAALEAYAQTPSDPEPLAGILHTCMKWTGELDLRRELLYAAGADTDLPEEEALRALETPPGSGRSDAILDVMGSSMGAGIRQMMVQFRPKGTAAEVFRNGSIPQAYLPGGGPGGSDSSPESRNLYAALAKKCTGAQVDACGSGMRAVSGMFPQHEVLNKLREASRNPAACTAGERYQFMALSYLMGQVRRMIVREGLASRLPMGFAGGNVAAVVKKLADRMQERERTLAGLEPGKSLPPEKVGTYLLGTKDEPLDQTTLSDLDQGVREILWDVREQARQAQAEEAQAAADQSAEEAAREQPAEEAARERAVSGADMEEMYQGACDGMAFEKSLAMTSREELTEAAKSLKDLAADHPVPPEDPNDPEKSREDREKAGEAYGEIYRTAADRAMDYRVSADTRNAFYRWNNAASLFDLAMVIAAVEISLKKKKREREEEEEEKEEILPGFGRGFDRGQKDFDRDGYRAGLRLMGCFAQASVEAVDPRAMPGNAGAGELRLLAGQLAGKLFLDTYGELFAGRNAREAAAGIGTRELACIEGFTETARKLAEDGLGGGTPRERDEFKERCRAYLAGEAGSPVESRQVERELNYVNQLDRDSLVNVVKGRRGSGAEQTAELEKGVLNGIRGRQRTETDKLIYGSDSQMKRLMEPYKMKKVYEGTDLWFEEYLGAHSGDAKTLYSLHSLGKGKLNHSQRLINTGRAAFEQMFATIRAQDESLAADRLPRIYRYAQIRSPLDMFYVDGKPASGLLEKKYSASERAKMTEKGKEDILKAELMAALLSGRHRVDMVRIKMEKDGSVRVCADEVNLDLSFLDQEAGFFDTKPSRLSEKLAAESEKDREKRLTAIRESVGEKLGAGITRFMSRMARQDAAPAAPAAQSSAPQAAPAAPAAQSGAPQAAPSGSLPAAPSGAPQAAPSGAPQAAPAAPAAPAPPADTQTPPARVRQSADQLARQDALEAGGKPGARQRAGTLPGGRFRSEAAPEARGRARSEAVPEARVKARDDVLVKEPLSGTGPARKRTGKG